MKKFVAVLVVFALLATFSAVNPIAQAENVSTIKIYVGKVSGTINGKNVSLDQAPVVINGRTMVPIRFISEAFGAKVDWDGTTRAVTINLLGNTIVLKIDSSTATVNNNPVYLDSPATIVKATGRTVVPVRFISETFGADIAWNATEKSVTIQFSQDWIKNPIQVTFWHAMGGVNGNALANMVASFNRTHPAIRVTLQFQGSYDDEFNKLKVARAANSGPDIIQVYDIGTRFMVDSKMAVPVQKFIDAEKYDTSKLEPNLLAYYTVDNTLYSMPFNSSTPILYYNKTAFKEAGLDPDIAPKTFQEIEQYSQKLTLKDSSGKVTRYGFSLAIYGWFFEQLLAKQGSFYANNGNGRDARATAVIFNNDAGLNILNWWKKLYDEGLLGNFGRTTSNTQQAFAAGKTAMFIDSTAVLKQVQTNVGDKFEIGTAFLPTPGTENNKNGGVIIGGASLWILNTHSDKYQKAAWEVIKYLVSPQEQAYWNQHTGYFPVNKDAYNLPDEKAFLESHPQFKVAIDQLHSTPINRVTQGALLGVFPEARSTVETAIETVLQGKASPQQALDDAVQIINKSIQNYNNSLGGS